MKMALNILGSIVVVFLLCYFVFVFVSDGGFGRFSSAYSTIVDTNITSADEVESISSQASRPSVYKATVVIGGDVMLDRNVRNLGEMHGYDRFLSSLGQFFKEADLAVVNLEGPITSNDSKTLLANGRTTGSFVFTFATSTAQALSGWNIDAVSLANNHTDNFGIKGLQETKKYLNEAGVNYFGSPWNSTSTELVLEANGLKIGLIGYHQFQPGLASILSDLSRVSSTTDFLIVFPHWGAEYKKIHSADMRDLAFKFIEAGADTVVGAHPHVTMDREWVGNVPIIYSLGNLLFDQYFSPDVIKGNIVSLHLSKSGGVTSLEKIRIYETNIDKSSIVTLKDGFIEEFAPALSEL